MIRYQLRKGRYGIQAGKNQTGLAYLKQARAAHKFFKRGRITEVVQLRPDLLPVGVLFDFMDGTILGRLRS